MTGGAVWCYSRHLSKAGNCFDEWTTGSKASDYESISVSSQNRQHAKNIFVPNVREFLEILAVLPMESTEVERSFSFMRRILTWLRILMITERLSDLAFIGKYANAVTIDRSVVCEKFVALHPRRMKASSLSDEASISSILWRFKTMQCYSLQFVFS